jgi:hypothetical protein
VADAGALEKSAVVSVAVGAVVLAFGFIHATSTARSVSHGRCVNVKLIKRKEKIQDGMEGCGGTE